MKIAFTGTSGSGKTTLVNFLKETYNLPHLNASAGTIGGLALEEVKAKHKYYADGHLAVIQRSLVDPEFAKDFQNAVIDARTEKYKTMDSFVTDRSPIDSLTYFALQAAPNLTDEYCEAFKDKCYEALSYLDILIYIKAVQPKDVAVENNGSRVPVKMYQKAVDAVFERNLKEYLESEKTPGVQYPKVIVIDFWSLDRRKSIISECIEHNPKFRY